MPVVAASARQLEQMSADASAFQAYVLGPVASAVLARYAFWQEILPASQRHNDAHWVFNRTYGAPTLVDDNDRADNAARNFATAVQQLNAGALELAHWSTDERAQMLTLGIVRAGSIPRTLELWPLVPVIVVGGALYGAWLLVDAWLSVRTLEAQNDALRAKTSAAVSDAIARAGAQDPAAAAKIADALERANNAANNVQPGLLDKLAGAVGDVGRGVRDSSSLLLLLGAAWLWSRRRAA